MTVSELWRRYRLLVDSTISYQSFFNRIDSRFCIFVRTVLFNSIEKVSENALPEVKAKYQRFQSIFIKDNTVIRLHEKLAKKYPATRSRRVIAGLKVSVLFNAIRLTPTSISFVSEKTHDIKTLKIGPWIRNSLIIMDLGFYRHWTFAKIIENKGFFISRLKKNAKPRIEKILTPCPDFFLQSIKGLSWNEILEKYPYDQFEAVISFPFKRHKNNGKRKQDMLKVRCVARYNRELQTWHSYITNLQRDEFSVDEIYELYRFRWEIEMIFKELKSEFDLGKISTKKNKVIESQIYCCILKLVLSRQLFLILQINSAEKSEQHYSPLLWTRVFQENCYKILDLIRHELKGNVFLDQLWGELCHQLTVLSKRYKKGPSLHQVIFTL